MSTLDHQNSYHFDICPVVYVDSNTALIKSITSVFIQRIANKIRRIFLKLRIIIIISFNAYLTWTLSPDPVSKSFQSFISLTISFIIIAILKYLVRQQSNEIARQYLNNKWGPTELSIYTNININTNTLKSNVSFSSSGA